MKVRRESRVIRWAYFLSDRVVPDQTSLCPLFWRVVLITPINIALPLAFFGAVGWLLVEAFIKAPLVTGGIIAICAFAIAVGFSIAWVERALKKRAKRCVDAAPSVLFDGFRAVKGKVCPIVKIVR